MPAFEGLRLLRKHLSDLGTGDLDGALRVVRRVAPDAGGLDLVASVELHKVVDPTANPLEVSFYRWCIRDVLLREMPAWAKLITLGRGRFIKRLKSDEYRDIRSAFREAHLLDEPATDDQIEWWDAIQIRVRFHGDEQRLYRARAAERLSFEHERSRMKAAGISADPVWVAIEDNTAGYDILSFEARQFGLISKLIEVKSTIASPLRFFLSREEWEQALEVGSAYHFHIWDMSKSPPRLYERTATDIAIHIPSDNEKGRWKTVHIPVK